jgi:predicted small metal-binding protein
MERKMDTAIKMYELVCDPGDLHFTMSSKDMDEVVDGGVMHVKRIHNQDISRDEIRKMVHEVNRPADESMMT